MNSKSIFVGNNHVYNKYLKLNFKMELNNETAQNAHEN